MLKKITYTEYQLFAEAWMCLAVARLLLIFLPFKKLAPLLGKTVTSETSTVIPSDNTIALQQISIAISRGCRYAFWRTKCFEQALAAKLMLKKRGISSLLYFGVYKNDDSLKLNAHAWVICKGMIITGSKNLELYKVVSRFEG